MPCATAANGRSPAPDAKKPIMLSEKSRHTAPCARPAHRTFGRKSRVKHAASCLAACPASGMAAGAYALSASGLVMARAPRAADTGH